MRSLKSRKGLTLLELVVVLMILVALAGILVPLLPGMLSRAHTSTGATNISEVLKAMELYNVTNRSYPSGLDSLVDGTDLYQKLPNFSAGAACGGDLVLATDVLTAAEKDRLTEAGITAVYKLATTTADATFAPYSADPPVALNLASDKLAQLSTVAATRLNLNTASKYVVFGLGAKSSLIGRGGIASAPVHFGDEAQGSPVEIYSRFGLVFDVSNGDKAQLVAVVALHKDGVGAIEDHVKEWFETK